MDVHHSSHEKQDVAKQKWLKREKKPIQLTRWLAFHHPIVRMFYQDNIFRKNVATKPYKSLIIDKNLDTQTTLHTTLQSRSQNGVLMFVYTAKETFFTWMISSNPRNYDWILRHDFEDMQLTSSCCFQLKRRLYEHNIQMLTFQVRVFSCRENVCIIRGEVGINVN